MNAQIRVYASEQTSGHRPGVRIVCACGWGIVAVHGNESADLSDMIETVMSHLWSAHGLDELPRPAAAGGGQ